MWTEVHRPISVACSNRNRKSVASGSTHFRKCLSSVGSNYRPATAARAGRKLGRGGSEKHASLIPTAPAPQELATVSAYAWPRTMPPAAPIIYAKATGRVSMGLGGRVLSAGVALGCLAVLLVA